MLKKIIVALLAFQIAFGPSLLELKSGGVAHAQPPSDHPESAGMDDAASRLETGQLTSEERDPHHLRAQKVFVKRPSGGFTEYDLARFDVEVPRVAFDEVRTEIRPGVLRINAYAGGQLMGYHEIGELDLVAQARDGEFFNFVDRSGRLYVADVGYWFKKGLQSPLPLTALARHEGFEEALRAGKINLAYVTPGLNPSLDRATVIPVGADGKRLVTAGDVVLRSGEEILGIYSREVIYRELIRSLELLVVQGVILAPEAAPEKLVREIFGGLLYEEGQQRFQETSRGLSAEARPEVQNALSRFDREYVQLIVNRLNGIRTRSATARDQRSVEQWSEDFQALRYQAKALLESNTLLQEEAAQLRASLNAGDFGGFWRTQLIPNDPQPKVKTLTEKLTSRGMKILAAVATTGGLSTAYALGLHGEGPVGMVETSNWVYQNLHPEILKVAEFRFPLLASITGMTLVVPMMAFLVPVSTLPALQYVSAALAKTGEWGKIIAERLSSIATRGLANTWMEKGLNALLSVPGVVTQRTFETLKQGVADIRSAGSLATRYVTLGARAFAVCNFAMFRVAASALGQPAFIDALKNGENPFKRISAESEVGRAIGLNSDVRLGVNLPVYGQAADRVRTRRLQALAALRGQDLRQRERVRVLVALAVGTSRDIAPEALVLAAQEGGLEILQRVASTPEGRRELTDVSLAYRQSLTEAKLELLDGGLEEVPQEDLVREVNEMRHLASQLEESAWWVRAREWFRATVARLRVNFFSWGEYQTQLLLRSRPDKFSTQQVVRDTVADAIPTGLVMGLLGDRADVRKPENFTFDVEGSLANLWTKPAHLGETWGNMAAHTLIGSGQTVLLRSQEPAIEEPNYAPREQTTLKSVDRSPGYLRSFFKYMYDLRPTASDLGGDYLRTFFVRFSTLQATILVNLGWRCLVSNQALQGAVAAEAIVFIARLYRYGWVWNPVHLGNKAHGEWIANGSAAFENAKVKLSQDLATGRDTAESEAAVRALFDADWRAASNKLSHALGIVEGLLGKGDAELKAALQEIRTEPELIEAYQDRVARLAVAINQGQTEEAKALARELQKQFEKSGYRHTEKMSPRTLLEFSIAHPPVFNKPLQSLMIGSTFLLGGALSTYLWSALSVQAFDSNALTGRVYLEAAVYALAFHASTYLLLGKKVWDRVLYETNPDGTPREEIGPDGVRRKVPKGLGIPVNAVAGFCSRVLSNFDARRSLWRR